MTELSKALETLMNLEDTPTPPVHISPALLEAYKGYYEGAFDYEYEMEFKGAEVAQDFDQWAEPRWVAKILADTPKARLNTYLRWEGILGYSETIWNISQGRVS